MLVKEADTACGTVRTGLARSYWRGTPLEDGLESGHQSPLCLDRLECDPLLPGGCLCTAAHRAKGTWLGMAGISTMPRINGTCPLVPTRCPSI